MASGFSLTGTTQVDYDGAQCSLIQSSQITALPALTVQTPAESFQLSYATSTDYRGNMIGGGLKVNYNLLNQTASMAVPGVHATGSGAVSTDINVRTISPFTGSLSLNPPGVSISSGQIEMIDNSAKAVATLMASGLNFSSGCGCPTSGSLSGNLSSGGNVSITFTSTCGTMNVTGPGINTSISVPSCSL
jgi:hypothetical protein